MDMETVITHLQIIHTWAEFARERDLQFFTAKHLEDIAKWSDDAMELLKDHEDLGTELTNAVELIHKKNERIEKLLKEQELPTELKQKMWNALYAEEDEYEKKFVGKEEHLNWFTVYRPWLQKGFDIAINAIADWEGR